MPSRWFRKEGILPVVLGLAALGAASYFLLFAPELRTIRSLRAEIAAKDAEVSEAMKLRTEVAQSSVGEGVRWEERLRAWGGGSLPPRTPGISLRRSARWRYGTT